MKNKDLGFTLVELIIVIAIIAILAGAIFVAIDPARRLHETRNARRSSDVATVLDALKKYQADNSGAHYYELDDMTNGVYYGIGTDADLCSGCSVVGGITECIDLEDMGNNYLAVVPADPLDGDENNTQYYIMKDSEGAITIGACGAEGEGPGGTGDAPEINITR